MLLLCSLVRMRKLIMATGFLIASGVIMAIAGAQLFLQSRMDRVAKTRLSRVMLSNKALSYSKNAVIKPAQGLNRLDSCSPSVN